MDHLNPFVFGRVVRGKNFCNRGAEMQRIYGLALSKGNLIVVSPRRYGKTSLVINALEKYNLPFLFFDCFDVTDEKSLLEKVTLAYFEALKKGDVFDKLKLLSKLINVEYSFSAEGINLKITKFDSRALQTLLQEVAKHYVLVFDEFQELFVADPTLVKKLRGILQLLHQSFIFLGSKKHLLFYLFSDQRSPFYNFGSILYLDKIPEKEWATFIKKKFAATKLAITELEIAALLRAAELIPFYVQYLCYYFWQERSQKNEISKNMSSFLGNLTHINFYVYDDLYQKLPSNQKQALKVVLQKNEKVFSQSILQEFNITSPQALNKALNLLVEKGYLEKNGGYSFNDPLFKRYLQEKYLVAWS